MNKIAKSAIYLMIATILSKVLGFFREIVLASYYGASAYSDAYITSIGIPTVVFFGISSAIATTYIPLYYENLNSGGEEKARKFTNNIINIVMVIGIIMSVIGFIFAEELVKVFAIGFKEETLYIATRFTKIMIFGVIFIGLSNIATAFLQINNNFTVPGLIGIPFNIIIIISIVISKQTSPLILPIGTLIGLISQFILQLPYMIKGKFRYKLYINLKDEYLKKIIWLIGPVFIGVGVNQINAMVDRALASTLVEGSISALSYANKLNGFVLALFISSIGAVIYPILSKLSINNNKEEFNKSIITSINTVILFILPVSVGAIILSRPIVQILFQRGEFDEIATNMTSIALIFYSLGMIGFGLRDILGKVFYSLQDTKTPMINGSITVALNIVLNLIFIRFMEHAGLALATSISSIICILLLFNSLKQKIGYFGQDKIIKTTIKSLISAIIMGVVTYFMYNILTNILGAGIIQEVIALFASIGIGAIVYGTLVIILKVEEVSIITNRVKSKILAKIKSVESKCI